VIPNKRRRRVTFRRPSGESGIDPSANIANPRASCSGGKPHYGTPRHPVLAADESAPSARRVQDPQASQEFAEAIGQRFQMNLNLRLLRHCSAVGRSSLYAISFESRRHVSRMDLQDLGAAPSSTPLTHRSTRRSAAGSLPDLEERIVAAGAACHRAEQIPASAPWLAASRRTAARSGPHHRTGVAASSSHNRFEARRRPRVDRPHSSCPDHRTGLIAHLG
jgi:hypothetical protein